LAKKVGKVADCFGTWKMTEEEAKAICVELSEGWRLFQKGILATRLTSRE